MNKRNDNLTPHDVKVMGLTEFERRFGFRPRDVYEKSFFAATGERPTPMQYEAVRAGIVGDVVTSEWNMAD